MKAIRLFQFDEAPFMDELARPEPAVDEIVLRVEAAALNPLDVLVMTGAARHFFDIALPMTLGTDIAGTVERVGSAVVRWKAGDRVIAWTDAGRSGGLAGYAAVPAACCVVLPDGLSAVEGSAIPTAGITAWHALFSSARLQAGETVLIHAAAGGVGAFAVQFAHLAGARVIATATGDGVALAQDLGADTVIDYRTQDFTTIAANVDVVLDLVGGDTQARSYATMRPGGRLVSTVMTPDAGQAAACGVTAEIFYAKPFADRLGELVATIADGKVRVVIDREVPIDRFNDAWARQTSWRARGKIVIRP